VTQDKIVFKFTLSTTATENILCE